MIWLNILGVILLAQHMSAQTCTYQYTIASGDTFSALDTRCSVTSSSTYNTQNLNPSVNANNLQVCQVVCVPCPLASTAVGCGTGTAAATGTATGTGTVGTFGTCTTGTTYAVAPGDTLNAIASRCGTTASIIAGMSGISNPNLIYPCQRLCLPAGCYLGAGYNYCPAGPVVGTGTGTGSCQFSYTVAPGDTLTNIANACGTTVTAITNANPIANPNLIYPCQVLCMPTACANNAVGYTNCATGVIYNTGACTNTYYVRPGDTLGNIAAACGTTAASIAANSGVANINLIYPCQRLCLPSTCTNLGTGYTSCATSAASACTYTYTVAPGDTLTNIANACGTTAATIASMSGIANANLIYPCQVLCMPYSCSIGAGYSSCSTAYTGAGTCAYTYSVAPGDTLGAIAARCGTTASALGTMNSITNINLIYPCQRLCLPAGCNLGVGYNYCPTGGVIGYGSGAPPVAGATACAYSYTVQPGDTLNNIAAFCGTTATYIASMSGIANPNLIYPCQVVCVPAPCTNPNGITYNSCTTGITYSGSTCASTYYVAPGDTLNDIAARCGTTAATIAANSGIANMNLIYPCQRLCLPYYCNLGIGYSTCGVALAPGVLAPNTCAYTYVVAPGDTLNNIAARCGTTAATIGSMNGIANLNVINACQVLCMPFSCTIGVGYTQCTASAAPFTNGNTCAYSYSVAPGDTLNAIASRCGTTASIIAGMSGISNPNLIYPCQRLCLPAGCNLGFGYNYCPTTQTGYTYTVAPGNTIGSIATACGTTATAIANLNGLTTTSTIYPCQVLAMPTYCSAGVGYTTCASAPTFNYFSCSSYYYVQPGDTLSLIASRCAGLTAYDIANLNGITNVNYIQTCQRLCLPSQCGQLTGYASCPAATTYTAATYSCAYTYTVAPGDTLNGIASACGTTATTIASLSGIANPNLIYPCQVVCLPASCSISFTNSYTSCSTGTTVYSGCSQYYTVQSGNTCASIAATYSTFNYAAQGINCAGLTVGQVVCVTPNANPSYLPALAPTYNLNPGCTSYYVAQPGSTCCSIASAYPNFYALNPLANCNSIQPGQSFCVSATTGYIPNNAPTCNLNYIVKSTDTCATLAAQYPQFYSINPTINCAALPVGQTVCVSSNTNAFAYNPNNFGTSTTRPADCLNTYTVTSTTSCSTFTTASRVLYCNPGINCAALQPNQVLYY